jgi:hypothetical protein
MDATKRLHLILAPKERFEPGGAGAFSLNALETTRNHDIWYTRCAALFDRFLSAGAGFEMAAARP